MYFLVISQKIIHLSKYRFEATFSGETFSTILGDLVTEHFNKGSKEKEKLRLHTTPKHKGTTTSYRQMHEKHVENLKSQLKDYNLYPFEVSSAICISTGQEIDFSVVQVLI